MTLEAPTIKLFLELRSFFAKVLDRSLKIQLVGISKMSLRGWGHQFSQIIFYEEIDFLRMQVYEVFNEVVAYEMKKVFVCLQPP